MRSDLQIKRTANTEGAFIEDVGIDHSGFEVFVPEEFLGSMHIIAIFEEMGGEALEQGMAAAVDYSEYCLQRCPMVLMTLTGTNL